jgi:hypothetical protein
MGSNIIDALDLKIYIQMRTGRFDGFDFYSAKKPGNVPG